MTFWTDEKIAQLKSLWSTHLSNREIYRALGATKGMVLGKADRLELVRPPKTRPPIRQRVPVIRRTSYSKPENPSGRPTLTPPISAGLRLVDLENDQCRFPTSPDDATEHLFCGAVKAGRSYCSYHRQVAYRKRIPYQSPRSRI